MGQYFIHPEFSKVINEYFDIEDNTTRKVLLNINENDQTQVLQALTSKLYDNIVDKIDDIDFGEIPSTRGDVTKLSNYDQLVECLATMENILTEYKQDVDPVKTIVDALTNIKNRTDMFEKAYKFGVELPMITYNTMVLSVISSTSFLIASCVEFIKLPAEESFNVTLDKVALVKSKDNILFENLVKFNKICANGSFDTTMEYLIKSNMQNLSGVVATGIAAGVILFIAVLNIVNILRELVFFFYNTRTKVSDYFEIQADLLQASAHRFETNSTKDKKDTKKIVDKQMRIVDNFRKIANTIQIKTKQADVKATKEILNNDKKYKTDEILDSVPDSAASSLF